MNDSNRSAHVQIYGALGAQYMVNIINNNGCAEHHYYSETRQGIVDAITTHRLMYHIADAVIYRYHDELTIAWHDDSALEAWANYE